MFVFVRPRRALFSLTTLARPKSRILTTPLSRVSIRFCGLRSRCTIPRSWACCNPRQACRTQRQACTTESRPPLLEELVQRFPRHELHDDHLQRAEALRVVRPGDVRMVELGDRLDFFLETQQRLRIVHKLGVDHLQGLAAVHPFMVRLVDRAHASAAEQPHDAIFRLLPQVQRKGVVRAKVRGGRKRPRWRARRRGSGLRRRGKGRKGGALDLGR